MAGENNRPREWHTKKQKRVGFMARIPLRKNAGMVARAARKHTPLFPDWNIPAHPESHYRYI
jgi:hypothetical protein